MKFEDSALARIVKDNLKELGYNRPTDIQFRSIGPINKGEDVLAIAQTGTGKTAAFAIPIVDRLHKHASLYREKAVRCLVMCPTHELAIQIRQVFDQIAKGTEVKSLAIFGGVDQEAQIGKLKKGVDVLVATPGRMFDLVSQGHLNLRYVEILILDEADHMLDLGFIKDIRDLMRHIPKQRQTLFFSATINEEIKNIAYKLVNHNAIRIQVSPKDPVAKNITHSVAMVEMDDKRFFLERLIKDHPESKMLVFVRTKVRAERVKEAMARVEIECSTIHGDKDQKERKQVMDAFRTGECKILVATDVSARGIDIPNVDYVVNYDLPEVAENYVHRVGRTGRGVAKGLAVSFCATEEKEMLDGIEAFLGKEIDVVSIDKDEYVETVRASDSQFDWKSLMKEAQEEEQKRKRKPHEKRK
jgi:ATP-dependent RNA helicase RhlE